ncbi:NAD(P)/FAD-dependent oxidoreductase [Candidatus Saccharibacteria bacterium]|nr:NAD(P)/FAD-dependent oxidoreductase [Candidatus Saccharibacteria bacterium]
MQHYDVIIIGAGLAGASLGYLLQKQGKTTFIIERADLNKKDKLCGGLLTKRSFKLFRKNFDQNNILPFRKFQNFTVKTRRAATTIRHDFYSISRKQLDDYLVSLYPEAGGTIFSPIKTYSLNLHKRIVTTEGGTPFSYDTLIGADGIHSKLRTILTGRSQRKNFALETQLPTNTSAELVIHFLDDLKGYAWHIPNNEHLMLGLGDVSEKTNLRPRFDQFLATQNCHSKNLRGAFLPTGNDIFLGKGNVFLIGDAAGLASPIFGEGIYYAFVSSIALAKALDPKTSSFNSETSCHANHNSESASHNHAAKTYRALMLPYINRLKREHHLKKFIFNAKLNQFVFRNYHLSLIKPFVDRFVAKYL